MQKKKIAIRRKNIITGGSWIYLSRESGKLVSVCGNVRLVAGEKK